MPYTQSYGVNIIHLFVVFVGLRYLKTFPSKVFYIDLGMDVLMKIPNMLTSARIFIAPFVYYAGFARERDLFVLLFALGGITDVLDGFFARYLDMKSDWGSRFDTIADLLFYPAGFLLYFFAPEVIVSHWEIIVSLVGVLVLSLVIGRFRGKLVVPHLLSSKIFAVFLYLFVLYTLMVEYYPPFFYVVVFIGAWAAVEQFIVLCFKSPSLSRRWSWE
jgi:phosphatidylglycerophosphate synthase